MKLQIESVKFKNFLSYGAAVHEIPFKKGVNIVLGKDIVTGRSNGSGKSSFLETIPFALFGQTHKDIRKAQLLNWKNRKALEVSLTFRKGENEYIVTRTIKPDDLEIYENDRLIEKPSHIKYYQQTLEEIIGLNFETFCSLIHSNINSSNRILSMKKPEKRKFIENVFGLGIYSLLSTRALEKIRALEDKLNEIEMQTRLFESQRKECISQIAIFNDKLKTMSSHEPELKEVKTELIELKKEFPNINDRLSLSLSKGGKLVIESNRLSKLDTKINAKHLLVERWIKENDRKLCSIAETKIHRKSYFAFVKEHGKPGDIIDKLASLKIDITKNVSDLETANTKYKSFEIGLTRIDTKLEAEEAKINGLKFHNECPTCGQNLKGKIDVLGQLNINVKLMYVDHELESEKIQKIIDEISELAQEGLKLHKEYNELEERKDQLYKLKDAVKTDLDEDKLKYQRKRYQNVSKCLAAQLGNTENNIHKIDKKMVELSCKTAELQGNLLKIENKKNKINLIKEKILLEKKTRKEFQAIINTNKEKIENMLEDNKIYEKKRKAFINIVDYLNVIREICKDDNIKQYAISSIMPYLNQRTNYYLSEVGYSFYTILNKWIEAEIRGPGVTNASYGSLSGGEGRGIDLALQFALLDIAKIQAGIWPDILIMDEILDSSVDGPGIDKLMDIIRTKQADEDNKIFIISHRDEVGISPDNTYFVKKEGFSKLEVK